MAHSADLHETMQEHMTYTNVIKYPISWTNGSQL